MEILRSGSQSEREWFLVGSEKTGRVFLALRTRRSVEVRWLLPNAPWDHCEPASALEADEVRGAIVDQRATGRLTWNDGETSTEVYHLYRAQTTDRPN